jgi:outer membrane receptor for monomeric catechols
VSKGVEFNGSAKITDAFTLAATYAYTDAHLTQDAPGLITVGNDKYDAFSGDRLPGSQKHSGSLIASYNIPVADDSEVTLHWALTYHGDVYTKTGNRGFGEVIPDYWLNRASANFRTGPYEFGLYATNIFNVYAVSSVGNDYSKIGPQNTDFGISRRFYSYSVVTPRTVGVEARVRF